MLFAIGGIACVVFFLTMQSLLALPNSDIWYDCIIFGLLLCLLSFLLRSVLKYAKFDSMSAIQKGVNHAALSVVFVFIWIGLWYFIISTVFTVEELQSINKTIPTRILIGFLTYFAFISLFGYAEQFYKQEVDVSEEEKQEELAEDEIVETTDLDRIAVKNGQKITIIPIVDIVNIQAEGDYVMLHTLQGKFLKEQTMKSLEMSLPKNMFVRVHRSNIININFISSIELYEKQTQLVKLQNGQNVKISVSGYKALKEVLNL